MARRALQCIPKEKAPGAGWALELRSQSSALAISLIDFHSLPWNPTLNPSLPTLASPAQHRHREFHLWRVGYKVGYGVFPPGKAKQECDILPISPPMISAWVKVFHWDLNSFSPGTQLEKLLRGSIPRAATGTLPSTPRTSFALNPGSDKDFHLGVSHQEAFPSTGCCGKAAVTSQSC